MKQIKRILKRFKLLIKCLYFVRIFKKLIFEIINSHILYYIILYISFISPKLGKKIFSSCNNKYSLYRLIDIRECYIIYFRKLSIVFMGLFIFSWKFIDISIFNVIFLSVGAFIFCVNALTLLNLFKYHISAPTVNDIIAQYNIFLMLHIVSIILILAGHILPA